MLQEIPLSLVLEVSSTDSGGGSLAPEGVDNSENTPPTASTDSSVYFVIKTASVTYHIC